MLGSLSLRSVGGACPQHPPKQNIKQRQANCHPHLSVQPRNCPPPHRPPNLSPRLPPGKHIRCTFTSRGDQTTNDPHQPDHPGWNATDLHQHSQSLERDEVGDGRIQIITVIHSSRKTKCPRTYQSISRTSPANKAKGTTHNNHCTPKPLVETYRANMVVVKASTLW
jgi:hypothetical protein